MASPPGVWLKMVAKKNGRSWKTTSGLVRKCGTTDIYWYIISFPIKMVEGPVKHDTPLNTPIPVTTKGLVIGVPPVFRHLTVLGLCLFKARCTAALSAVNCTVLQCIGFAQGAPNKFSCPSWGALKSRKIVPWRSVSFKPGPEGAWTLLSCGSFMTKWWTLMNYSGTKYGASYWLESLCNLKKHSNSDSANIIHWLKLMAVTRMDEIRLWAVIKLLYSLWGPFGGITSNKQHQIHQTTSWYWTTIHQCVIPKAENHGDVLLMI